MAIEFVPEAVVLLMPSEIACTPVALEVATATELFPEALPPPILLPCAHAPRVAGPSATTDIPA
jgi:hypothetical protein